MMADIRQSDFDGPVGNLVLRDGTSLPIQRADLDTYQLGLAAAREPANLELQVEYLRRALPTASAEQLGSINPDLAKAVTDRALLGIPEAERLLGESSGASLSDSTDSAPAIATDTSAPELAATTG